VGIRLSIRMARENLAAGMAALRQVRLFIFRGEAA
jgi:hypothetical protein